VAIDAVRSAAHPHSFLGVTEQGLLRHRRDVGQRRLPRDPPAAGTTGPNYDAPHVHKVVRIASRGGAAGADHDRHQPRQQQQGLSASAVVAHTIAEQVTAGEGAYLRR
jgi:3-deoxy-7-phosphoheptulonate synthase